MTEDTKKRGPKPEVFRVPLPFDEAVRAALQTAAPPKKRRPKTSKGQRQ